MINSQSIYKRANRLVNKYGTRDPEEIALGENIRIYDDDIGRMMGLYTFLENHRVILVNSELEDEWYSLIVAHELGHDRLHRAYAKNHGGLQEFVLYNLKNKMEYEANAFASHILLDNDEVYDLAIQGYDVFQMSKLLDTHMNLLLIKLTEMTRLGYDMSLPCSADGRFLRKLKGCGRQ